MYIIEWSKDKTYAIRLSEIFRMSILPVEDKLDLNYGKGYYLKIELYNDKWIQLFYADKNEADIIIAEIANEINK